MKRIGWWMVAACTVALAAPALAGVPAKCTLATQACLNHWAKTKDLAWTGLQYESPENMVVKTISPGSPAATAGFQAGDMIVALNGAKVADKEALKKAKGEWKAGQVVQYTVSRSGAEQQIAVTLAAMPPDVFSATLGNHMLENHVPTAMADASVESGMKAIKVEKK